MKTITLSEEAYERLKSWKTEDSDSFSKVVLKMVPKRGTAGDMDSAFGELQPLSESAADEVLKSLAWANDWKWAEGPLEKIPREAGRNAR
jgi:predicted CopG family antitoxin